MAHHRLHSRVLALIATLAIVISACSSDDSTETSTGASDIDGASTDVTTSETTSPDSIPPSDAETFDCPPEEGAEAAPASFTAPAQEVEGDLTGDGVVDMGSPTEIGADDPLHQVEPVAGSTRNRYSVGPIDVRPGQNNIAFTPPIVDKPEVEGYVVRLVPNIVREDGTVPPVDVVHLHHAVWLNMDRSSAITGGPEKIFAAGEEKTAASAPLGYGYWFDPDDTIVINYMIHNLFDTTEQIWITYDWDFIPADSEIGQTYTPVQPVWMDVVNGSIYPVFDVFQGDGDESGTFTYPDDATDLPEGYETQFGNGRNTWTVAEDEGGVIIGGGGHLHPGGLWTDLYLQREGAEPEPGSPAAEDWDGEKIHLYRSQARYFDESGGPISWDMAMTVTPQDWKVAVEPGDVLSLTTTYETERASWYESMGIFVMFLAPGEEGGLDPFTDKTNLPGDPTHGPLPENNNKGGELVDIPDPRCLPSGEEVDTIEIVDFLYMEGDISEGTSTEIPVVREGESITFDSSYDAELENGIWHTITACEAPCTESTGIAFPLANGPVEFDSGQLGYDEEAITENAVTWQTPDDLDPGTYTYFCRIHPFMRGAFRVEPGA